MAVDVIVLVYDPDIPATVTNIKAVWVPELLEHAPMATWLLVPVGRETNASHQETSLLAADIGAVKFRKSDDTTRTTLAIVESGVKMSMDVPENLDDQIAVLQCRQKLLRNILKRVDDSKFQTSRTEHFMHSLALVDGRMKELTKSEPATLSRKISVLFNAK
eukprot:c3482_g1_i2.p2 GENE.c3482_g1_i2~~c3482_g1_i2.p2  ORF type:complete len:162 (+),score=41.44 c3482_g1_i2:551-1036(+)